MIHARWPLIDKSLDSPATKIFGGCLEQSERLHGSDPGPDDHPAESQSTVRNGIVAGSVHRQHCHQFLFLEKQQRNILEPVGMILHVISAMLEYAVSRQSDEIVPDAP